MPVIIVKEYAWRQTQDCIIIHVNVKVAPKQVDLFTVDNYMKAHFKPFVLELFLWGSVKDEDSLCTITEKELIFKLLKVDEVEWPAIESLDLTKQIKTERRNSALQLAQDLNQEKSKRKSEKQRNLRRKATQAQINLQTERMDKIDSIRNSYRQQTMKELDEWSKKYEKPCLEDQCKIIEVDAKNSSKEKEDNNEEAADSNCIWDSYDSDSDIEEKKESPALNKNIVREIKSKRGLCTNSLGQSVPMPRKCGKIDVTFSERVFVTPARESIKSQEEEWLTKQAKARRSTEFIVEDLRPEEQDPQWCLDKGENFMKVGNYYGAISAFSHGIKLNGNMESLYIMRSAAQYALKNYYRCIEDTSKALELMTPECEANREARARCYARRGAALCQLSSPQHGLPELEAALKLLPNDDQILADIRQIKSHFNLN